MKILDKEGNKLTYRDLNKGDFCTFEDIFAFSHNRSFNAIVEYLGFRHDRNYISLTFSIVSISYKDPYTTINRHKPGTRIERPTTDKDITIVKL